MPGITARVPQYSATAMPGANERTPLVVKSHDGRPTKVEAMHCIRQHVEHGSLRSSLDLNLYDPTVPEFYEPRPNAPPEVRSILTQTSNRCRPMAARRLSFLVERSIRLPGGVYKRSSVRNFLRRAGTCTSLWTWISTAEPRPKRLGNQLNLPHFDKADGWFSPRLRFYGLGGRCP